MSDQVQQDLPLFPSLPGKDIWAYADAKHQDALDAALTGFDNFFVTDSKKKDHLKTIANGFITKSGCSLVHHFACGFGNDTRTISLLKRVLNLGANPDHPDKDSLWRPSHYCSFFRMPLIAEVLVLCRPNLQAVNRDGDTPAALAGKPGFGYRQYSANIRPKVGKIWEKANQPTIAQLAFQKEFWAVRNLVLRGVVCDAEKFSKYQDRTALEWTELYGMHGLVGELRFLLGNEPAAETEELKEVLTITISNLREENLVLVEKVGLLEQQLNLMKDRFKELEQAVEETKNEIQLTRQESREQYEEGQEQVKTVLEQLIASMPH